MDTGKSPRPDFHRFNSGAIRDEYISDIRLDLISKEFVFAIGKTLAEGGKKYGEHNWKKGMPKSSVMNHILHHLFKYVEGDISEEHLAHAACGIMFQIHYDAHPELYARFDDKYVQPNKD